MSDVADSEQPTSKVSADYRSHWLATEVIVGATTDPSVANDVDALIRKLEHLVALNEPQFGGPYMGAAAHACVESMHQAAKEIRRLTTELAEARAEEARLREHSVLLNKVAWELEQAYATIPQGGVMLTTDIEHNLPRWVAAIQRDSTRRWPRTKR